MIEKVAILCLTSISVCCVFWEGMLFEKLGDKIEEMVGEFWAKPLGKCYICSTFWISIIICFFMGWPVYLCLPAMGMSAVISIISE